MSEDCIENRAPTFVSQAPAPLSDIERAELFALRQEKVARNERLLAELEAANAALGERLDALEAEQASGKGASATNPAGKAGKPAKGGAAGADDDVDHTVSPADHAAKAKAKRSAPAAQARRWL